MKTPSTLRSLRRAAARRAALPVFAAACSAAALPAFAQMQPVGTLGGSAALTGVANFGSDLDKGGDVSFNAAIANGSLSYQLAPQFRMGLVLRYTYEDWSFGGERSAFGGVSPWSSVQRPGVGLDFTYAPAPDWLIGVSPSIDWSYANGASASDGEVYGALVSVTHVFSPQLVLGLGAGVYRNVGKTQVLPVPIISWQIDPHWRVQNPFPAGPTGGGGAELVYAFDTPWEVAGGATYRTERIRLSRDGAYPGGVAQLRQVPVFGRVTYRLDQRSRFDFYAGALTGGKIDVYDAGGDGVASDKFKAAPFVGLTFATRF